jgi:circadian clock protein KaiC
MKSIGFNFEPYIKKGLLKMVSTRPTFFGLEKHLLDLYKTIEEFKPNSVVIDPLTSLIGEGSPREVRSMITRMIDVLKTQRITAFFTSLVSSNSLNDMSGEISVSSMIDTWIVVRELEERVGKKRIRGLYIVKSRGTNHSSDVHKIVISDEGIKLEPMEVGSNSDSDLIKKVGSGNTERSKKINKNT